MIPGRLYNKQLTAVNGTNLTGSSSQSFPHIEIPTIPSATSNNKQYQGEDDSQKVLSGAGGDSTGASPTTTSQRWGYVAPTGSRVEVNDTPGGERIDIVHRSGAGIAMESDGSIYIISKSSRGAGIAAPLGDIMITAGGDIVIKGAASLSIETAGDLNLDVGGTFTTVCENYNLNTKNYAAIIDGSSHTSITNDQNEIVGGIDRKTVAGDQREQITGQRILDVGNNNTERVGGDYKLDVQRTSTHSIKGDHKLQTQSKTFILSSSDTNIDTGADLNVKTTGDSNINATGQILTKSGGNTHLSSQSDIAVTGDGNSLLGSKGGTIVTGPTTEVRSEGNLGLYASGSATLMGSSTEIHGSTIANKCGTFLSKPITGDPGGPSSASVSPIGSAPAPDSPDAPSAAKDAEVMEANDIVDTLTSARKYPEYPGNGVRESANATGLGMISGDETPQAEDVFNEYSGGNQGNMNPSQQMDTYDTLSEDPVNRDSNITAVDVDGVPSYGNLSAKISKYYTLGMIVNGTTTRHKPGPSNWQQIVKQGVILANNVLDPIKEKFPDVLVTSWYRTNSGNHKTGRAIDLVVESRSMTKHAEIARFARDTLPVDQVFIEKNTSGRTHIHLRVATPGSKTSPSVLTCGDPQCRSKVPGIQVGWLARRAS